MPVTTVVTTPPMLLQRDELSVRDVLVKGAAVAWTGLKGESLLAGMAVAIHAATQFAMMISTAMSNPSNPTWASMTLAFQAAISLVPCTIAAGIATSARDSALRVADRPPLTPLLMWLWLPMLAGTALAFVGWPIFANVLPLIGGNVFGVLELTTLYGAVVGVLLARFGHGAWPRASEPFTRRPRRLILGGLAGLAVASVIPVAMAAAYSVEEPYRTPLMLAVAVPYCVVVGGLILGCTSFLHSGHDRRAFARPEDDLR